MSWLKSNFSISLQTFMSIFLFYAIVSKYDLIFLSMTMITAFWDIFFYQICTYLLATPTAPYFQSEGGEALE